jgi:hypothetical protein
MLLTLEKPESFAVLLSKAMSILTTEQCARPSCFWHLRFSSKRCSASYIQFNGAILHKGDDPPPWKHWEVGSTAFTSLLSSHRERRC